MIIYLGNKATERDTLDFLTDMLADGYSFRGLNMGYGKLKYTGHHDRSNKIGVMSKDDYDKLSEQEKKDFKYIDETGENVFYQTKKTIGDNNFYRNKKEEKERNPSNYIIGRTSRPCRYGGNRKSATIHGHTGRLQNIR